MVSVVRVNVLSDHGEATAWKGKPHYTLLTICITNVKKYFFLHSGAFQLYD